MSSTAKSTEVQQLTTATQTDIQPPVTASQTPPSDQGGPPSVPVLQQSAPLVDGNAPASLVDGFAPAPLVDGNPPAPVVAGNPPAPVVDGNPPALLVDGNAPSPSANNALQAAAMAQAQAGFAIQSCENLAKAQARADRWTRDLKIRQVKDEFKTPADKKVNFAEILFITNVLIISYLLGHGLSH